MKTLLILGAGTGGTMVANRMARALDLQQWRIVVVDQDENHIYQPGLLFVPFGLYSPSDIVRPKQSFLPPGVEIIFSDITHIDTANRAVMLGRALKTVHYDQLVIATGTDIHPEETPGLLDGGGWGNNIYDFYTLEGAACLSGALADFNGGRLVLNIAEMPIKCPIAPIEFLSLADWYFRERGIRDRVELVFVTPISGPFSTPRASEMFSYMLARKGIYVEADFALNRVDNAKQKIISGDNRSVDYDLLVSVPTHKGAEFLGSGGLGDELNFVATNKHTLQATGHENIWVIGDAANLPTLKSGSVAHFQLETLATNLERAIKGEEALPTYDGRANCFVEAGDGKAVLIDLNYDEEPLPGNYPVAGVGPFSVLKETRINHAGKMALRWIYWNVLLKGKDLPLISHLGTSESPESLN
ncbi:MAG: FAD-dependent oxidoreductase [Chloroflexi bacterium]|nr:FAD-dependent oxidoreductase [Chloroflexota bacterium]